MVRICILRVALMAPMLASTGSALVVNSNMMRQSLSFVRMTRSSFSSSSSSSSRHADSSSSTSSLSLSSDRMIELTVQMPPSGSDRQATMRIEPLLSIPSELVVIRYSIPFHFDLEPRKGLAVITKNSTSPNGERMGDILRYTSYWHLGFPSGSGLAAAAANFAGSLSWQCSMFDIIKATNWEQVIEVLMSNLPSRTDEVVMIFERSIDG